jgi:hypothetical protein
MSVKSPIRRPGNASLDRGPKTPWVTLPNLAARGSNWALMVLRRCKGSYWPVFDHTRQQQVFTRRCEQNGPILRGKERFTFRQESG